MWYYSISFSTLLVKNMRNYKDIKSKLLPLIKEYKDKGKKWLEGETENKYISYFSGGIIILYFGIL